MQYNGRMSWAMIGHNWAVRLLQKHIAAGQVRHAYLFGGPEGIGKTTLAHRFAQALECPQAQDGGEPCLHCKTCRQISEGTYPDMECVEAEEGGSLQVAQVRELQRRLALSPYQAQRRIALLLRFHEATASAANAFLKTLEEPGPHVLLLLTAHSAASLLPTIVSRCECINLRPVGTQTLVSALLERGLNPEQARLAAGMAWGLPGKALAYRTQDARQSRSQHMQDLMHLLGGDAAARFAYAARYHVGRGGFKLASEARSAAEEALLNWEALLRSAMMMSFGDAEHAGWGERAEARALLRAHQGEGWFLGALHAMERTLDALSCNVNAQLAMESLLLRLPRLDM
jgi:DNA polymerase-3 subunit delta'